LKPTTINQVTGVSHVLGSL